MLRLIRASHDAGHHHLIWGNLGLTLGTLVLAGTGILYIFGFRRYSKWIAWAIVFVVVPVSLWIAQFELYQRSSTGVLYTLNAILLTAVAIGWVIYEATRQRFVLPLAIFAAIFSLSQLLQYFAYLYWSIGNKTNFNQPLSHLDALYFAVGTFTTAGTGKLVATSDSAVRLQLIQMGLDFTLIAIAVTLLFMRFSMHLSARLGERKEAP